MAKTTNQKAWWLVVPVLVLVAFNAFIPLMTVVNYSMQETFGDNVFFWEGVRWFEQVLNSERFHASLMRQLLFTGMILAIEIPLGIAVALSMPRKGPWVSVCLVLMALPLLIPWNVIHSTINSIMIISMYLIFNVIGSKEFENSILINNLFFLCSTAFMAISIKYVKHKQVKKEFAENFYRCINADGS